MQTNVIYWLMCAKDIKILKYVELEIQEVKK